MAEPKFEKRVLFAAMRWLSFTPPPSKDEMREIARAIARWTMGGFDLIACEPCPLCGKKLFASADSGNFLYRPARSHAFTHGIDCPGEEIV